LLAIHLAPVRSGFRARCDGAGADQLCRRALRNQHTCRSRALVARPHDCGGADCVAERWCPLDSRLPAGGIRGRWFGGRLRHHGRHSDRSNRSRHDVASAPENRAGRMCCRECSGMNSTIALAGNQVETHAPLGMRRTAAERLVLTLTALGMIASLAAFVSYEEAISTQLKEGELFASDLVKSHFYYVVYGIQLILFTAAGMLAFLSTEWR